MKGLYFLGGLVAGVAGGVFIGMKISEKKFQEAFDKEREDLKAYYHDKVQDLKDHCENIAEETIKAVNKPPIDELIKNYKSENNSREDIEREPVQDDSLDLISADEFDDMDYNKLSLIFEDGILMDYDSADEPEEVDDEKLINYLNDIREYTDDTTVYVRDESRRCDYEIILTESPCGGLM